MRLATCQLLVEGGEPKRNIERACHYIERASEEGCDLVLLPETIDFGWTHPSSLREAEEFPGQSIRPLLEIAKKLQINIVVGLTSKLEERLYNIAVFINRQGEVLSTYQKINLLEVEFPFYNVGKKLEVIKTEFGNIGLNICSDNYADSLHIGHSLAHMGAEIILSPSAWTVDHHITEDDDPYGDKWVAPMRQLSLIHNMTIASATSVGYIVGGPYEGKKMVGASLVYQGGEMLSEGITNELSSSLEIVEFATTSSAYKGVQVGKRLNQFKTSLKGML